MLLVGCREPTVQPPDATAPVVTATAEADTRRDEPLERRAAGAFGIVITPGTIEPTVVVYLHGMWASPEDSCSFFERAVADAVLICPRGNAPAQSGGAFRGTLLEKRRSLDAALDTARELVRPRTIATAGGIAMGFSSGAAFALELALAEPGRWSGLVLMSMKLHIDPAKVRAAGVKRVALAAGELDGSRSSLMSNEKLLVSAGVEARFFSPGPVGHHFATDMEARMADVLAWVRAR